MFQMPLPLVKEVALIGGGHAHALLLRSWGMKPVPGARLTLINPAPTAPYTGMLPGFVAGHYTRDTLEIDLVKLARFADARLILGTVEALDPDARTLRISGRPDIPFDLASVDIGITSDMPEIDGFRDHGVAAKPLGPFASRWQDFLAGDAGDVAVIGGGVAGVELALAMHHALAGRGTVTVIEAETALRGLGAYSARTLRDRLYAAGIDLLEHARVQSVAAGDVTLSDDRRIPSALTVGAAGARPFRWLADTGLALEDGYIMVDETLRSTSHPHIYAAGDCAHLTHAPRPKAGVFAVRAAPVLTHNLGADLTGKTRKRFQPQSHYLKLISLGEKEALADKWRISVGGAWAWTWKDRIDRAFMERLNDLPAMTPAPIPAGAAEGVAQALGPKPLCGGCGAKVGPDTLDNALADLRSVARDDVHKLPGDDAAILTFGSARQVISTDHLRAFWSDPWLMARIAAVHAANDVLAMGAEPQAALAQITLPPMTEAMQAAWLTEILDGANGIFTTENIALAGGHTSVGSEFTIGFTVTGIVADKPLALDGAAPGDALILTAPLGSGTVLAAEMEGKAQGDDVARVLSALSAPRGAIARALSPFANTMTDVTGFGLAGHLSRMANRSGLSCEIALDDLPIFDGAEELAAKGVRSTIWAANRAAVEATLPETLRAALLFDPQTAGGFLAAVPSDKANHALTACREAGAEA
ncbi:MAG: selenide, water dikinase SelD, partial [Silicimonas sp.]|nr:selenide, water dikinase SelD [Silicimonas sp.]